MKIKSIRLIELAIFMTGVTGMVSEYSLSTMASYVIGNSIVQFSMIIGVTMFFMGLGSKYSKYIEKGLFFKFILFESLLSVFSAYSIILSYYFMGISREKIFFIYFFSAVIGFLIGLEIPLITRINEKYELSLKENISNVLSFDYFGSLAGSIVFSFVFLPKFGLMYTSCILGTLNFVVAFLVYLSAKEKIGNQKKIKVVFITSLLLIIFAFSFGNKIVMYSEQKTYRDQIIYKKQTKYQNLIMTRFKEDYRLYIDGQTQFSTFDEYRYHEMLIHVPMLSIKKDKIDVLIMGGGDGLAVRELLKYKEINSIKLVDLDPDLTELFKNDPFFSKFNNSSLKNEKVKIINADAFNYVQTLNKKFDFIIADFPDPNNVSLGKLYSLEFYTLIKNVLEKDGIFVTQSTSPIYSKEAFLCINKTLKELGFKVVPYKVLVPSFGMWGFNMAAFEDIDKDNFYKKDIKVETRYLDNDVLKSCFSFGKDLKEGYEKIEINRLLDPKLLKYYNSSWVYY